jgi:hypothetical protein
MQGYVCEHDVKWMMGHQGGMGLEGELCALFIYNDCNLLPEGSFLNLP